MINIGRYKEISGDQYPSIMELISETEHPNKKDIVRYLKSGKITAISPEVAKDIITGENLHTEIFMQTDGIYRWRNTLAYYVEKYNFTLPHEFINHILAQISTN